MPKPTGSREVCLFCRLPRAEQRCEVCAGSVCRSCLRQLDDREFKYLAQRPPELTHVNYCPGCFATHVEPALEWYQAVLHKANNVHFWTKGYRGTLPIIKAARTDVVVEKSPDKQEVMLELAFRATELGFNALINVEVSGMKVRDHGRQWTVWSGRGQPVEIDMMKLP